MAAYCRILPTVDLTFEIYFKAVQTQNLHWTPTFEIYFSGSSDRLIHHAFLSQASRHLDDLLSVLCTDVDDKLEEEATLNMLENINIHTKGL